MALTLRPTDLERSPATAHIEDWIVLDDGILRDSYDKWRAWATKAGFYHFERVGTDEPPKRSSRQFNDHQTFHLLHRTSVSLEDAFWKGLKESAGTRRMTLPQLVASIDAERRRGSNLSSAIRLFVLDFYRQQIPVRKRPDTAKA